MGSPEGKEVSGNGHLAQAYREIHEEEPKGKSDAEIAAEIVEVLDNPNWVRPDLAKECLYAIVHLTDYRSAEERVKVVGLAEEKAGKIFPELEGIREVHMDQIEWVYEKWKRGVPA